MLRLCQQSKRRRGGRGVLTVLGLDASLSCSGWVLLGDRQEQGTIEPPKGVVGAERLRWIHERVGYILFNFEPSLCVLEGYAMGYGMNKDGTKSFAGKVFELGELGGVIRLALHQAGVPLLVVAPASLKKFGCGNGKAQKDEVRLGVYKQWGFEHPSNDVVDAMVLAQIGLAYSGGAEARNAYQRELVESLKAPPKKGRAKKVV